MIRIGHFFTLLVFGMTLIASEILGELREVVVSHADEKGVLQLYRMKEDGSEAFSSLFRNMDVGCQAYLQMGRSWLMWNRWTTL
jgi:hypothetical protein